MPFPLKIQPLDTQGFRESIRNDTSKPASKSRLRRLFDRQFPSVLRNSTADKTPFGELHFNFIKDAAATEFEPSSVCLAKMVQNFIEENEKPLPTKCGRNRCNCFNVNRNDISDDEFDSAGCLSDSNSNASPYDTLESFKSLVLCASASERNVLADISRIVEKNKGCKRKDDMRSLVTDGLILLGYDSSICKSRWEKCSSCPAGEYDYIDVIVEGERLLIDVDFRSEFEIARSTGSYKSLLQSVPHIFVGNADRLEQMLSIVSEAAIQSLKKKGMHVPPWRKPEYMLAKWLSPHTRATAHLSDATAADEIPPTEEERREAEKEDESAESEVVEVGLLFDEMNTSSFSSSAGIGTKIGFGASATKFTEWADEMAVVQLITIWQPPPAINVQKYERGANSSMVPGLASLLRDKP